jgi:trk system potassium uptake protein TrkH
MQRNTIQRIVGLLLMAFSLTMLPPAAIGIFYQDGAIAPFTTTFIILLISGFLLWTPVRNNRHELRLRGGFIIVAVFWLILGLVGSIPFLVSNVPGMSITNAVFESVSGLTTTGATVISGIDDLPHSILFYRQQLQWIGGMGIIVLAVAILPMLGIGGMQIFRAETPGPMKYSKLTPRITETAKALWYIYLGLTISCAIGYWLAGMNTFDAISHSFSTISIGGFSTHDKNLGYFDSVPIEVVSVIFMLLAGMNFALHFRVWKGHNLKYYLNDTESRTYIAVLSFSAILTSIYLYETKTFSSPLEAIHYGIFQAVSIGTTSGFTTAKYSIWPGFLPVLLLFTSFIGGCAGSTGGGLKVIRFLLLVKQGGREIFRLIHPNAQSSIKIGGKQISENIIDGVWGFFALYVATFAIMMLLVMLTGLNHVTAFSAVAACFNNLGPGLGDVGTNYANINTSAKWILSFAMLLGRLEIFTILVLISPEFWRK